MRQAMRCCSRPPPACANRCAAADLLARVGGDEFALLQTAVTDPDVGGVVADTLIRALTEPFVIDGERVTSHASTIC